MSDTEYQPLTGDPDLLQRKAQHYASIADAITRSVTTLHKIHDVDDMKSQATDALRGKSKEVADDIDKARDRYAVTASALITYSSSLRSAQDAATTAISHINSKQAAADQAQHAATTANQQATDAAAADKTTQQAAASKAADAATTATSELSAAQGEWHAALTMKNNAADQAIRAIVEVVDGKKNHGLNDSWWDDWGSALLNVIKKICEVAGFLSIFLSWVPILGAVLVGLAILGAVITLVESIVKFANGGSFTDVVFAAVGVVLAAFGGKFVSYLGKLTKFSAASKAMTKGESFLNSKAFKTVFGESKAALRSGKLKPLFKDGPGFRTMMKDIRNPFDLKLGSGTKFVDRFTDGFATQWAKTAKNPLGLQSKDVGLKIFSEAPFSGAKIAMVAMDGRSIAGKVEKLWNFPDKNFFGDHHQITLAPDSVLKLGGNALESSIRR